RQPEKAPTRRGRPCARGSRWECGFPARAETPRTRALPHAAPFPPDRRESRSCGEEATVLTLQLLSSLADSTARDQTAAAFIAVRCPEITKVSKLGLIKINC